MTGKLSPDNRYIGYTERETCMLDVDNVNLEEAISLARDVMTKFDLGGYLLLESSEGSYHVIFNRRVDWSTFMQFAAEAVLMSNKESVKEWFIMQCRKGSATLRVSLKGTKPCPKAVHSEGKQDCRIKHYLDFRRDFSKYLLSIGGDL